MCGKKNRFSVNKDVETVELRLSKCGGRKIKESDYFKQRNDPNFWKYLRQGDVKLEDLFKQAAVLARKNAKKETRNDDAEKKYVAIHGNCVGVSGQAGIGKTTLTKQLVEKVVNEELLDIEYLFYVSLKKVNYDDKLSALQFLLTNLDSNWEHDPTSDNEILKRLEESENVLIIFDGLDEASIELEVECPNAKLHDVTIADVLLKNILNGNILGQAKKLITSRPRQMWKLQEQYRPHFIVEILGISLEAQREMSKVICKDDNDKVFDELSNHPALMALCYVPIICIFIVHWLHQRQLQSNKTVAFPSVTNIVLNVLEFFVKDGTTKHDFELEKLSKLAWRELRCKKYEFNEKDINNSKLKKESLYTIFTKGAKANTQLRLLHVEKITYFSHLILQEFFAAVYLVVFSPFNDFKNEQPGDSDMVTNFICGLCNAATYDRLTKLSKTSNSGNLDLHQKKLFLEQFICEIADDISCNDFPKCLKICSMLYEMQSQELTQKVVERFPEQFKIHDKENIFPHDLDSLFYVLQERKKLLELEIKHPTFVGDSLERFLNKIADTPNSTKVSIDKMKYKIPVF